MIRSRQAGKHPRRTLGTDTDTANVRPTFHTRWLKPALIAFVTTSGGCERAIPEARARLKDMQDGDGRALPKGPIIVLLHGLPHELPCEMRHLDVGVALDQTSARTLQPSVRRFAGGEHLMIHHQGSYRDLMTMLARLHAACDLDMDVRHESRRPSVILLAGEPPCDPDETFEAEVGLPVCAQAPERPVLPWTDEGPKQDGVHRVQRNVQR